MRVDCKIIVSVQQLFLSIHKRNKFSFTTSPGTVGKGLRPNWLSFRAVRVPQRAAVSTYHTVTLALIGLSDAPRYGSGLKKIQTVQRRRLDDGEQLEECFLWAAVNASQSSFTFYNLYYTLGQRHTSSGPFTLDRLVRQHGGVGRRGRGGRKDVEVRQLNLI